MAVEEPVNMVIPDASKQFEKTPAWRFVKQIIQDEEGKDVTVYRRRKYIVGEGEDARVLRWHEVAARLRNAKDKAEAEAIYTEISGKESTARSKKASIKDSCKVYFEDEEFAGTEKQILDRFDELIVGNGRWGLGCPRCRDYPDLPGASKFWEFKPTDDMTKLESVDLQAMTGNQAVILEEVETPKTGETLYLIEHWDGRVYWTEEVPMNRGYLNWTPQKDSSIVFTCDRCGTEVKLT